MKELKEKLFYSPKNGYDRIKENEKDAIMEMGADYIKFLNNARTERAATSYAAQLAEQNGFVLYTEGMQLEPGSRVYAINRHKSIILAVIGKNGTAAGARIAAAHVDAPRIDLKPRPFAEERPELLMLRTHYYGGVKKYQWAAIPLAMMGVVALKDGSVVDIEIGTKPGDPVFTITDILPHLAKDQMGKTGGGIITGEGLRVLVGSIPMGEDGGDRVKLNILNMLNEQYGIVEEDFLSAELSIIPAFDAVDVGMDRGLVGGYGQDDRSCAYAELVSLFGQKLPEKTAMCVFADKEEIGSEGATGMKSQFLENFIEGLLKAEGADCSVQSVMSRSECLSADVSAAFDPLYGGAYEYSNSSYANYGLGVAKYVGSGGKSGTNDANAEFMAKLRRAFDDAGVVWHTCELGAVDQGGGGTVAKFMAQRDIETIDVGVPVLSMHSPFEIVSKLDVYMTAKAITAFFNMDCE